MRLQTPPSDAPLGVRAETGGGPAPEAQCLAAEVAGRITALRGSAGDTLRLSPFTIAAPSRSHVVGCGSLTEGAAAVWVVRPPDARLATLRFSGRRTAAVLLVLGAAVGFVAYAASQIPTFGSGSGRDCSPSICF